MVYNDVLIIIIIIIKNIILKVRLSDNETWQRVYSINFHIYCFVDESKNKKRYNGILLPTRG